MPSLFFYLPRQGIFMRKIIFIAALLVAVLLPLPVQAQETTPEPLDLRLTRDWGYGGTNGEIQGTFSLRVNGPDGIVRVDFIIHDEVVSTDTEPPFRYQFNTGEYPPGEHTLTAVGYLSDDAPLRGKTYQRTFLSAAEARSKTISLVVPLLILVGVLTVAGIAVTLLVGRRQGFQLGKYGMAGGAICPRCGFPYSRHMMSLNLLTGKLERCPHCGKWAVVPAASQVELREAEERWKREGTAEVNPPSEEEILRQMLEDSRFDE
jgi:GNAT superfamily N-acetyltransferase